MKCKIFWFYCLCLMLAASWGYSQSDLWYLTRGGQNLDQAWGVDVDSSGNIYFATCEIPLFSYFFNIYLYKFDQSGNEIWESQPWGGDFNDKAFITIVKAPYVYMAGRTDKNINLNSADAFVLAFNMNNGELVWQYTWDGGAGYEEVDGLVVEEDGIYISGWTAGVSTSNDFLLQKLSLDGQLIWSQTWGTDKWDEANGHIVVDENHIYVAGRINGTAQLSFDGDAVLACFRRLDGSYQWHKTWGGSSYDNASGMTASLDSYLYLVGVTYNYGNGSQIFLLKYTKIGELIWSSQWGGSKGEFARAIVADGDSIIYIAGKTDSYGAGANDIVLLKFNSDGTLRWDKTWGGKDTDASHDLVAYGDYLYIAGDTQSYGAGKWDALLLKLNRRTRDFPTSVTEINESPRTFHLGQNYPNPFNPETVIKYQLSRASEVEISIFNLLGQKVTTLVRANQTAGLHKTIWNGKDKWGQPVASGFYLYQLKSSDFVAVKKMVLLR